MFHLHLTASTSAYEKDLIHRLIQKGYSVAPASDLSITLQSSKNIGALISLQLEKLVEIHAPTIYDDVMSILDEMGAKYYSIVITAFSYDSIWTGSNIESSLDPKILN